MKVLNQQELKSIEQLFQLTQNQLLRAMKYYLETQYDNVIATKDFIIAVGDIPVGLIAHLDTVFKRPPQNIFYDRVKNVMWSPEGLGADDRAGIFSIIQIIKKGFRPTVIFTTDEEFGCLGAGVLVNEISEAPMRLKYIIQLDRRGNNDCVFYDCDNLNFNKYIESFGFITNSGSFSDISVICPCWNTAGVNLSIGYYNEHSPMEILHIDQMFDIIVKVENMLIDIDNADYFEYIKKSQYIDILDFINIQDDCSKNKCKCCGYWDYEYDLFPVKIEEENKTIFLCCDCISQYKDIYWCSVCGEPFVNKNYQKGETYQCQKCRGKNLNDFKY